MARGASLAALATVLLAGAARAEVAQATAGAAVRGTAQVASASALPAEKAAAVRELVATEMSRLGIPGLSLAVGARGEIRDEAGLGFADVESEVRASADTVYRLASVSKPMTAVAALKLAAQGRLDLDAPVWRYCPAYPEKPWVVTARQLLAHQGGVRGYRPGEPPQTRRFESVVEGLSLFANDPLVHEPGTAATYTTYGYCLLGCAIEGASGRPFREALRELVLEPAGMAQTQPEDLRALVPRRASGYVRARTGELWNSRLADVSCKVPGGGLTGTAPDAARFGLALLSGRLLGRHGLDEMLTRQRVRSGRVTGFGLGLTVGMRGGRSEAWHTGGQEQVSTVLYLRPDSGLVVALLSNLERVQDALLDLARRVADVVEADRVYR